ncbi:Transposase [Cupriavidus taiwanensis]|nr:hypothetical protein CT19431_40421 [Cupriavidus taiwanensis]
MRRAGRFEAAVPERLAKLKVYGRVHFPACWLSDPFVKATDGIDPGASAAPQQEFSCTAVTD